MDTPTPSLAAETNAVRDAYAALNRNDIPAFLSICDPRIERIEPADFPGGGIYRGIDAVRAHLSLHRGKWAEGACEPERFVVTGKRILVFLHVHVRLQHETEWRDGHIVDGFAFRNGKAIQWHTFAEERQARAWAGAAPNG